MSPNAAAEEPPIRKLRDLEGPNVFTRPPLSTVADAQKLFRERRDDLRAVLADAGWEGEPADLFQAVEDGRIEERTFPVGGRLQWMAYRSPARAGVVRNVEWAGEEPFEAFEIRVTSEGWRWVFILPKPCGNLALLARTGAEVIAVKLDVGELRLRDAEGREVVVRGGESATLSASRPEGEAPAPAPGAASSIEVSEGRLEFHDQGHPIAVGLEEGNRVQASTTFSGRFALELPEGNAGPVAIRIGDAEGTLSADARMSAGWPEQVLDEDPPEVRVGFTGGALRPRAGLHDQWILPPGAGIEIEVDDPASGVDHWLPLIDGEEVSKDALKGPFATGAHAVSVVAVDEAGNRVESDPVRFSYDPDPPEMSWGVEGVDAKGSTSGEPSLDLTGPAPSRRGFRHLKIAGRDWQLKYDSIQITLRPVGKRGLEIEGIEETLDRDRGLWVIARDAICPDLQGLAYELVSGDRGAVLRVEASDCVGNTRRWEWPLTPAERTR